MSRFGIRGKNECFSEPRTKNGTRSPQLSPTKKKIRNTKNAKQQVTRSNRKISNLRFFKFRDFEISQLERITSCITFLVTSMAGKLKMMLCSRTFVILYAPFILPFSRLGIMGDTV
jgi:hypothetical protein